MVLAVVMNQKSPWAREIALHLTELGAEVHIIDFATRARHAEYLAAQVARDATTLESFRRKIAGVHLLRSRFSSELRYITSARDVARIAHSIGANCLLTLYGGGSSLLAWASGVRPFAVYTVGSDVLLSHSVRRWLTRFVLAEANIVFSNGVHLARETQRLAPAARVMPLYLGIDTTKFTPIERQSTDEVRLISTRGFLPVYNNEAIVRALGLLGESDLPLRVRFVSSGPTLEEVRTLAKSSLSPGVLRATEFLGGAGGEELVGLVQSSDVYVSMSRSDGTSTSLLEALACGAFPVVSDIPANREWIDPKKRNGLLVPLDDDRALAEALHLAIQDCELRRTAAEYNRRLVVERADIRQTMSTLLRVLRDDIETPREMRGLTPATARS